MPLNSTTCAINAVESQAARVMHAFCAFLKGNVNCRDKQTDVTRGNERRVMDVTSTHRRKLEEDEELTPHHTRTCFPGKF